MAGIILFFQVFSLPPVYDLIYERSRPEFSLHFSWLYYTWTPFTSLADYLSTFSMTEHLVTLAWVVGLCGLFLNWQKAILSICAWVLFLTWGVLVPRPQARLIAPLPDQLIVDFHSHTSHSHDGCSWFTPKKSSQWHRSQGYDAVFVTDHNKISGAQEAYEQSLSDWKQTGFRSLMGEEVSLNRTHLVVLGVHEKIDHERFNQRPEQWPVFMAESNRKNLLVIASLPEYWLHHWPDGIQNWVNWGVDGFEILSSAPKALDFPIPYRRHIVQLAQKNRLFVTGISDAHGYGSATAAWNVMSIPGWRALGPHELEAAIIQSLKTKRFEAVEVLARMKYFSEYQIEKLVTPFLQSIWYLRTLSPLQRVAWVLWILGIWGICAIIRKRGSE